MKTTFFSALLLLLSTQVFAQQKEVYLNDDLEQISKTEYDKLSDGHQYFDLQFDLDTALVMVKVQRVRKGNIDATKLDSIKAEIAALSGRPIPDSNILIIKYHQGLDRCLSSADARAMQASYRNYLRKLEKQPDVSQVFMFQSPAGTAIYGEGLQWIEDRTGIVARTFFPISYPCGGLVIIAPNGDYYLLKGEHSNALPLELLKKLRNGK
ncbi:MAG: hypothetical protein Kow0027_28490 [Saprospiraceae bacterium]